MKCKIALVGEAWGQQEEKFGHAFVGPSGRELARMLNEAGLAPPLVTRYPDEFQMITHWKRLQDDHGIWLYNVYPGRPPRNNFDEMFLVPRAEADFNISLNPIKKGLYVGSKLAPFIIELRDLLALVRPNITICLGNIACMAVLGEARITAIRGTIATSKFCSDIKVIPTFHPAHILRNWPLRTIGIADLQKAGRQSTFPDIRPQERWITVKPSLKEIRDWLAVPAQRYAVDIESGQALFTSAEKKQMTKNQLGILARQISMIGFARDRHHALVIPFMSRNEPDLNYWKFPAHEVIALRLTQEALAKPIPKTFQNGLYDIPMCLSYGLVPNMCDDDTMLFQHSLFSEMQKGLGFLASIYAEAPAWKSMYKQGQTLKKDD